MKASSKMISDMEGALNFTKMVQFMSEILLMANQKEKESIFGLQENLMKENGFMGGSMAVEDGLEWVAILIWDVGLTARHLVLESK